jgi:hypothetical protein
MISLPVLLLVVLLSQSITAQQYNVGNVMALATCGDGTLDSQVFSLTTTTDIYSQIIHTASGFCIEMFVGADTGRLPQLRLANCNTALQQLWIVNTTASCIRNNATISGCKGFNVWTSKWEIGDEVGPYACSNDVVNNNELFKWSNKFPGAIEAYNTPTASSNLCMSVNIIGSSITLDNTALGPVFDGIGVGASEGSSRLLFDYPSNIRDNLIDNMFSPTKGSGVHILKVEIGGDGQSTMGSEPSHQHYLGETPVARGTQLWLAAQAKAKNPELLLYACPWSWPGFLRVNPTDTTPFGDPSNVNVVYYIISWLQLANTVYGLTFDFIGIWSDVWDPALSPGYVKALRSSLDSNGFAALKIVCADIDNWDCAAAVNNDPALANAISILGNEGLPTLDAITTGKPLWNSWLHLDDSAANFEAVPRIIDAINNAFVLGNQTGIIPFAAYSGSYQTLPEWGSGAIRVDSPWSGNFYNGPLWYALAHTAQFAFPNWYHLKNGSGFGSGLLENGGSYISRVSAIAGPGLLWSTVVSKTSQSAKAELITFTLANDMIVDTVYLWQSQFGFSGNNITLFSKSTVNVVSNQFSIFFDQGTVTTITNSPSLGNIPAHEPYNVPTTFPTYIEDDFSSGSVNLPGRYWSDINGAFEIVDDDFAGRGLKQTAQMVPITRRNTDRIPHTVMGDPSWRDIDFLAQVFLSTSTESAGLCVRCSAFNDTSGTDGSTGIDNMPGAWFFFNVTNWWFQVNLRPETIPTVSGVHVTPIPFQDWLSVRLIAREDNIIIILRDSLIANVRTPWVDSLISAPTHGFVGFASGGYGQNPLLGAYRVNVTSEACTIVPNENIMSRQAPCQSGTAGQTLSFLPAPGQPVNGPGQFVLMANTTLCVHMNLTSDVDYRYQHTRAITLQVCNVSEPRQFFTIETPSTDGPYLIGPIVGNDALVVNVYGNEERLDADIAGYEWQGSENEWWSFDNITGLLYETNMGTCFSFCQRI